MESYIRFLGIVISSFYFYLKIANRKTDMSENAISIIFINIVSFVVKYVYENLFVITIPTLLVLFIVYNLIFDNSKRSIVVVKSILSFALSYAFYILSALITSIFIFKLSVVYIEKYGFYISFVIQIIMIQIPFMFNRTQKGMTFLGKNNYVLGAVLLGVTIIVVVFYINFSLKNAVFLLKAFILFIFLVILFLYWRASITRHYLERLSIRNIDSLNAELDEKNDYIRRLTEDKDRLEKINHRNYKLVPAMQGAVMHYLNGVSSFIEQYADNPAFTELALTCEEGDAGGKLTAFITEGNSLLEELNRMNSEWTELVGSENVAGERNAPSCGITRVDYILSYMYERATREDFLIKADIDNGFNKITEKIITEEELATLIADLIENAIIANRHNGGKDILVRLGIMNKEYVVEVYDCGIAFDKEVLLKYGLEKITTHSDENGSGIGMMQTHEILNKCGASIYIDELSDDSGLFTKRITVVFNRKNQYVLYTNRSEEEVAYLNKRSDLMVIKR